MAPHGFGCGEYKYLAYPSRHGGGAMRRALPSPIRRREPLEQDHGNRRKLSSGSFRVFRTMHEAGRIRPTPLLVEYGEGDFSCLHQDVYGDLVFPLQVAFLLSISGEDFTGGEFMLTEQRTRMQSRAEAVGLNQGDGVIFAVHHRPIKGTRRPYRVNLATGLGIDFWRYATTPNLPDGTPW
jgi:hypothetical protein